MSARYLEQLQVRQPDSENAYFRDWLELHGRDYDPHLPARQSLDAMFKVCERTPGLLAHRDQLVKRYSWAVPCSRVLDFICAQAAGRQIVELGAGTGYWAQLLTAKGASLVPLRHLPLAELAEMLDQVAMVLAHGPFQSLALPQQML